VNSYPKVSIIILNWNGWRDTIECLESLYQITYPNYDVIVVDNGSEDESIEKIKEYCDGKIKVESNFFEYNPSNKPIKIIEYTREEAEAGGGKEKEIADLPSNKKLIFIKNEKNFGFAEGNNIGMRYALKALSPDYILLLNNDTVVDKRFLDELVKVAESDKRIGIIGPKIYYYNDPNRIHSAGAKVNLYTGTFSPIGCNEIDIGQFDRMKAVDYISGCALLIKRELLEKIEFLNPIYFAYFEETEMCMRAKNHGYGVIYTPQARIWHKVSSSTKKSGRHLYYLTRNRFIFIKNNSSNKVQCTTFLMYFFLKQLIVNTIILLILNRNLSLLKSFFKGMYDGLKIFLTFND